jgi:hypothetical protein
VPESVPALRARYNKIAVSGHFGSWANVFQTAGVARETFMLGARFPDKASILDALRERQKGGLAVNAMSVLSGRSQSVSICFKTLWAI